MTTSTNAAGGTKKDIQKLQRAIVDGLEDVKAQDIVVFDTERLSALFERVVVASGTSNRQTKALASSVIDAVRSAGFAKPRIEGEENGEWIIVDCGPAVVHIMQPAIRQYYRLEDLWGEKPVRLKLGAAKPPAPAKKVAAVPVAGTSLRRSSAVKQAEKAEKATQGVAVGAKSARGAKPKAGASAPARKAAAVKKPAAKAPAAKKAAPRKAPSR